MFNPKPHTYYIIEPHSSHVKEGEVDITEIATRVYGKPFDALSSCQAADDQVGNDQVVLFNLSDDEMYLDRLFDFDDTDIYLGLDRSGTAHYHNGHTRMDYWLSVKWAGMDGITKDDVTVEANPPECADLYGAVFEAEHYAQRCTSVPLDSILADLIRREELPRGDYIFRHWW